MILNHDAKSPDIDPAAWVAPNATVVGDVTIGARVGIWYSAVIRADTESIQVGEATNIQDGCVLHADPGYPLRIGARVSVGHGAILHGCQIGDDVLVGMGAVVMNGASIGNDTIVGAGTLIPEGVTVPDGVLVLGAPGRVRRSITDEERKDTRATAERYVERRPQDRDVVSGR
jgi:carbonic anhydrase/acetyltransferase-like protein (isoleucine patch superfamily)